MRLFRGSAPPPPAAPSFGAWVLRHFAQGEPTAGMTFARLEQVCSNAGSALCGAAYAAPEATARRLELSPALLGEAALVARRTADGFKACLEDRQHTVITWPWDHLATRIAWEAQRSGDTSEEAVGRRLGDVSSAYGIRHREQLGTVLGLWQQVAVGLAEAAPAAEPPSLVTMGAVLLTAFETRAASA